LVRIPDSSRTSCEVRKVPRAGMSEPWRHFRVWAQEETSAPLFDHLVGARQERFRDHEPDGAGGLEIDDKLEFLGCSIGRSAGFAPCKTFST